MSIQELYQIYLQHPLVQTDTRKPQEGALFFALKGENFNGNIFAKDAIERGAVYAIIDDAEYKADERYIMVENVLETLQQLALYHRRQFRIPFLAITGSNGKTTTKELIYSVLKQKFNTYATEGNLNNHIGVPLTILKIKRDAEMAIIEMGANHLHEIESYCKIALPTHGLITNCGKAHLEGFGSMENIKKGKGELYDFIRTTQGTVFRNADLDYLQEMSHGIENQITYGSANAKYIGKILSNPVFLKVASVSKNMETTVTTQLAGDFNFPNVMAAIAAGAYFGLRIDTIQSAIENYAPDNSRSQFLTISSNHIILDAYNANPTSMRAAIQNFANSELPAKRLWIGAMKEMGKEEKNEHGSLVDFIDEYVWDEVILVGKEFEGVQKRFKLFATSSDAANYVQSHFPEHCSILIKGSRGSKMELLLEALKVHP